MKPIVYIYIYIICNRTHIGQGIMMPSHNDISEKVSVAPIQIGTTQDPIVKSGAKQNGAQHGMGHTLQELLSHKGVEDYSRHSSYEREIASWEKNRSSRPSPEASG